MKYSLTKTIFSITYNRQKEVQKVNTKLDRKYLEFQKFYNFPIFEINQ